MIVKFFTRGTGGSSGVFNYLLKDPKQPDGNRQGATLLRGDVVNQSLLIDSLDFKQKYTSGCLSFTESPDQITQEQKSELMDGFEKTIRAGLDSDRIAVSWIEHRDKGRLELNFVFANVDLEHGRAFQPYVHYHDKKRVNAWKDIQNIKHGFTDPNDPANKRLMAQRDNLPRDVKQAREAITNGLEALVAEGVIKSRADVIQTLTDGGFEIARQTDKAISIKNPNGKRNIRLTGGLYERDFEFSRDLQAEVRQSSQEYRARDKERLNEAQRIYDTELAVKRAYHQKRHRKPKRAEREATADNRPAPQVYRYLDPRLNPPIPRPFKASYRAKRKTNKRDARRSYEERQRDYERARIASMDNRQIQANRMVYWNGIGGVYAFGDWYVDRGHTGEKLHQAPSHLLRATPQNPNIPTTAGLSDGQAITRTGAESPTSPAGHDRQTKADAGRQRPRYRGIDRLITQIGTDAERGDSFHASTLREIDRCHRRTEQKTSELAKTSRDLQQINDGNREAVNHLEQHTHSANNFDKEIIAGITITRGLVERYDKARRQAKGLETDAERNRQLTAENNRLTADNTAGAGGIKQVNEQLTRKIEREAMFYSSPTLSR